MNTFTVELKTPHIGQQTVLEQRRRFNIICTGRRWGKEELINQLISDSIQKGHKRILIIAPLRLSHIGFQRVSDMFKTAVTRLNRINQEIDIVSGLRVQFAKTEDYLNVLHGFQGDRIIINEPDYNKDIIDEVIKLSCICLTNFMGDFYIIGTQKPEGVVKGNRLLSVFPKLAQATKDNSEWITFQCPTSNNPYFPQEELPRQREDLLSRFGKLGEDVYKSEWEGKLV
jgi:hypothetical protein